MSYFPPCLHWCIHWFAVALWPHSMWSSEVSWKTYFSMKVGNIYIYIKLSFRIYWILICKRFCIVLECVITNLRYDETSLSFHWQDHPSVWTQRSCDNCWCQCPLHKQWGRTSKGRSQWQLEHVTWRLFSRAGAW